MDVNREFECCGLYVDGMDYQELCRHDGLSQKWQTQLADYEDVKHDFITYNDWLSGISQEEREQVIRHLLSRGLSHKEAEDYCDRNEKIAEYFAANPMAGYTFVRGQMISYGKKAYPSD